MRKIVLVLVGLVFGVGCASTFTEEELKIEGEIEAKIREEIKKPEGELTDEDLLLVTRISFPRDHQVANFAPISRLKNLKYFGATANKANPINSLNFLQDLEGLSDIVLNQPTLASFESLSKLMNLRTLDIHGNKTEINNISTLGILPNLTNVDLRGCNVTSLKGLGRSKSIKKLCLLSNKIENIGELAQLAQIEELQLGHNPISDITPISQLKDLRMLHLGGTGFLARDWTSVSKLKNLVDFRGDCRGMVAPINSLQFLFELEKIQAVQVYGAKLEYSQIEAIQKALPNLKSFKHDIER